MKLNIYSLLLCLVTSCYFGDAQTVQIDDYQQTCLKNHNYFSQIPPQKGNGSKPFRRWENFWGQRLLSDGKFPKLSKITRDAVKYIAENDKFSNKIWKELGPVVIPHNTLSYPSSGLGRISCIGINPQNDSRMLLGAASGGLWTSYNSGITWDVVPFSQILSVGISDIAFSQVDTNIVYAATGDIDGIAMSRNYSIGIIRSDNGGRSWRIVGDTSFYDENYLISAIGVFPENKFSAVAATNCGLLFTDDGFETISRRALTECYIRELEISPNNPNLLLAAFYDNNSHSIMRSIDRGITWTKVLSVPQSSRISIDFSKIDNMIYAIAVDANNGGFAGFFVSNDLGENWNLQSDSPNILSADAKGATNGGQGNYDLCLLASPKAAGTVYIAGVNLWKTEDFGATWQILTHWAADGNLPFVHADHHDLAFANNGTMFSANDGGIYSSKDYGSTWQDNSNGLSISQIYRFDVYRENSNKVIAGTQDNGTLLADKIAWSHIFGGDGMGCLYMPDDELEMFFSINNGTIYRSTRGGEKPDLVLNESATGEKSNWITEIVLNPQNQNTIFAGYWNLWVSDNFGNSASWRKLSDFDDEISINDILISPSDTTIIYVAKAKKLFSTNNYGFSWNNEFTSPGGGAITSIAVDSNNSYYVGCSGYLDTVKVFRKVGSRWDNISYNLPNVPVNCIVADDQNSVPVIYAGTDIGCFWLNPYSHKWQMFGSEMPHVVIDDIKLHKSSKKLFAGTYGRGLWQTSLIEIYPRKLSITSNKINELCPDDSLIVHAETQNPVFWSDGTIGDMVVIKETGSYFAYSVDAAGNISVSDTFYVSIPQAEVLSNQKVYCVGENASLSASLPMKSIEWNTGDTSQTIITGNSGEYYYNGLTENNCEISSDTFNLIFNQLPPKPSLVRLDNTLIINITDTVNYKIRWFAGDSLLGENNIVQDIVSLDSYYVILINDAGCESSSDTIQIESKIESDFVYRYVDKILLKRHQKYSLPIEFADEIKAFDINGRENIINYEMKKDNFADINFDENSGLVVVVVYRKSGMADIYSFIIE